MSRKPVHVLAQSPKPTGRQAIWKAIRMLGSKGSEFIVRDVVDKTDIPVATVRDYMTALVAANIISVQASDNQFAAARYTLLKDVGAEAPRLRKDGSEVTMGRGTEAMWRTMKIMAAFTAEELAMMSSIKDIIVKTATASDYLKYLRKAGYVRLNDGRYSFVRSKDPGPLAPQIQRIKQVFDPNSKTVVWPVSEKGSGQ